MWPCWPHFWQKWREGVGCAGLSNNLSIFIRILMLRSMQAVLLFGTNLKYYFPRWDQYLIPSAVAGTQLCCALDPPRQAYGLRMAYRVPYPNVPSHLPFLLISFLTFLFLSIYLGNTQEIQKEILRNPKEGPLRTRHRASRAAEPAMDF